CSPGGGKWTLYGCRNTQPGSAQPRVTSAREARDASARPSLKRRTSARGSEDAQSPVGARERAQAAVGLRLRTAPHTCCWQIAARSADAAQADLAAAVPGC